MIFTVFKWLRPCVDTINHSHRLHLKNISSSSEMFTLVWCDYHKYVQTQVRKCWSTISHQKLFSKKKNSLTLFTSQYKRNVLSKCYENYQYPSIFLLVRHRIRSKSWNWPMISSAATQAPPTNGRCCWRGMQVCCCFKHRSDSEVATRRHSLQFSVIAHWWFKKTFCTGAPRPVHMSSPPDSRVNVDNNTAKQSGWKSKLNDVLVVFSRPEEAK